MNCKFPLLVFLLFSLDARAQTPAAVDFQLTKISRNLLTAPQFAYSGAQQFPSNQRDRWLEVEVEFNAMPEFTEDLTLRYLILINGTLLTGEVTHTNIAAGRDQRSVMYVPPRVLARFAGSRIATTNVVQNIGIQIVQDGAIRDELSLVRTQPKWYATLPRVTGLVLNKNQTPFAPLYWDRYAQIKTPP